jgi:hypothetical protein
MIRPVCISDNDGEVFTSVVPHRPSYEVKSNNLDGYGFRKLISLH